MAKLIGVIAEDHTDVEIVKQLIGKFAPQGSFGTKRFVGRGSGSIKAKCNGWAINLQRNGCRHLILIHDLDNKPIRELKEGLEIALKPNPFSSYVVVIPIQEIEAWLLCDPQAIKRALKLRTAPREIHQPERLDDPKRILRDIIYSASGGQREYINTVHNEKIAKEIGISRLRKCPSFKPLELFVKSLF